MTACQTVGFSRAQSPYFISAGAHCAAHNNAPTNATPNVSQSGLINAISPADAKNSNLANI